jgi:hypothetical protein
MDTDLRLQLVQFSDAELLAGRKAQPPQGGAVAPGDVVSNGAGQVCGLLSGAGR